MPANLENSTVATGLENVHFHSSPKERNAKECSNYCAIALISHASTEMLKIIQARLQQYVNCEHPDIQAGFRKGRGTEIKLPTSEEKAMSRPLQHYCLENPMDTGAWWATVHGVAKSWTQLSDFTFTFHFHALEKEMATLQCSCLENPRDGGAWWAAVYGVAQSWTRLK